MALMKCPECGQEVSSHAPACIHCGYPLNEEQEDTKTQQVGIPADRPQREPLTKKKKIFIAGRMARHHTRRSDQSGGGE